MKIPFFTSLLCIFFFYSASAQKQVTHLVLFKLKTGIAKTDERYKTCLKLMREMPAKIKQIENWDMGENFSDRPIAFDVGLSAVFASKKDLQTYITHPAHVEAVAAWKEIADWNMVDFESEKEE